jgi:RNA 2',3'-cyclic 3'-phosphodiesterase
MSDILRLFIALPLSKEVIQVVQTQQDFLKAQLAHQVKVDEKTVRWTTPEQWHLTLAFLGATNRERLPQIQSAMERAARNLKAFELETTSLGSFPSSRRPSVLWLGVGGQTERLQTLHLNLSEALRGLMAPDDKPFKPHLTLARLKQFGLGKPIAEAFGNAPAAKQSWFANELCLYQTILKPQGAEYQVIYRVLLEAPADTAVEKN